MSVSVGISNQTYGSISPTQSKQSSLSSTNLCCFSSPLSGVCSSKKQSFISGLSTPLKWCIILSCLLFLTLFFLFASGVVYVNLKNGKNIGYGINIGFNNNKLVSKHHDISGFDPDTVDECKDTSYTWEYTETYLGEANKHKNRLLTYYCYDNVEECWECKEEFEENNACEYNENYDDTGCFGNCTYTGQESAQSRFGEMLYCFYTSEYYNLSYCYSWDSIVTKVIINDYDQNDNDNNNNNNDTIITQDIMINDIKLGDYVITGINGEYSKVIDRSHFNVYEKSTEKTSMIEICFDTDSIGEKESVLYNCIKMTGKHLIYVNGIDLESLDRAENIEIGDYLYHTGLKQFVVVNKINTGINDYFRNVITEDGNIIINNGFFASTIAEGGFFRHDSPNHKPHESHVNMVMIFNSFYKIFTLNGIYEGLWESELFDYILRIPTKNAIGVYMGYPSALSQKYQYSMVFLIFTQCTVSVLLCLFVKRVMHTSLFDNKKSV